MRHTHSQFLDRATHNVIGIHLPKLAVKRVKLFLIEPNRLGLSQFIYIGHQTLPQTHFAHHGEANHRLNSFANGEGDVKSP